MSSRRTADSPMERVVTRTALHSEPERSPIGSHDRWPNGSPRSKFYASGCSEDRMELDKDFSEFVESFIGRDDLLVNKRAVGRR